MTSIDLNIKAVAKELGLLLANKKYQITVAESCTGGGIAHAITEVAGCSQWFECAFITYSNNCKHRLLGVNQELILDQGAVSEAVVVAMAQGAQSLANANVAIAVSGIAGPTGGSQDKPVGTVWLAWLVGQGKVEASLFQFPGNRESVRKQAVYTALNGACQRLQ